MGLAITREQKEQAKREGKALVQISIDVKHLPVEMMEGLFKGRFELAGPLSLERARELNALCSKWLNEGNA